MGELAFYIRDSIRVGPFRFNLSKSGVGVSVGVRGARVGFGPRGNYVHMGRHGLYYRAALPFVSSGGAPERSPSRATREPEPSLPLVSDDLQEIESGEAAAMRDSSSEELLREIAEKRARPRWAGVVVGIGLLLVAGASWLVAQEAHTAWMPAWMPVLVPMAIAVGMAVVALVVHRRDELAKSVVLFYQLDDETEAEYQALHDAFGDLRNCHAVWHVEAAGANSDWKRSGGATKTVRRKRISLGTAPPSIIKTNIAVPRIPCGRETLYFFPDRVLVLTSSQVGAVSYADLRVQQSTTRFIEDGAVPRDAEVVGTTWQYVNRSGGPDRRFKNNRQLPVARYDEVHFRSASGLNELLQLSRRGAGARFAEVLAARAKGSMSGASSTATNLVELTPATARGGEARPPRIKAVGAWAPLLSGEHSAWEERFGSAFRPSSALAGQRAHALGREAITENVLFWLPDWSYPFVVVYFGELGEAGQPTCSYFQSLEAWQRWAASPRTRERGEEVPPAEQRPEAARVTRLLQRLQQVCRQADTARVAGDLAATRRFTEEARRVVGEYEVAVADLLAASAAAGLPDDHESVRSLRGSVHELRAELQGMEDGLRQMEGG